MLMMKEHFRPEFLNRIDDIVVFQPLQVGQMKHIVQIQMKGLKERLKERKVDLELTDYAVEQLGIIGYDPSYGARPVKRIIQQKIENPLANMILAGQLPENSIAMVDYDEEFRFSVKQKQQIQA
jgi:ATP-dependent Clp protease ATP-binding subunit ClpB